MHEGMGAAWFVWLESTALATAMRHWLWLYPIVEIVHIAGFVVLVGGAAMFDLRLLGVSRRFPVTGMARHLLPWARASLVLVVPTGLMMFAHASKWPDPLPPRLLLIAAGRTRLPWHLQDGGVVGCECHAPARRSSPSFPDVDRRDNASNLSLTLARGEA
jgi:hypothetical protein